jgi:SWI/SNF-related matrix-associated actin-dependent regulator of chromatin subfamily A3
MFRLRSSIKETNTGASKASCDLMADRRLCLTGTPVQNKLDDVFALIKFLRIESLDDKSSWMEFIGTPVKYGQPLGIARLQTIMKCITLRRTKESRTQDGQKILALPPRRDELRFLKFDKEEQEIYDQFFNESKAEFTELSDKNEVMKNYVGILQKILRLRQICDHYDLVQKEGSSSGAQVASYESTVAAIANEGINSSRASIIFTLLKEAGTTQCVECGCELCNGADPSQENFIIGDATCQPSAAKRGKKTKATTSSRGSTRQSSPAVPRPVLTRCQHLFCIECFRQCVFPGWPNVAADIFHSCSACQSGLTMLDAVEVSPESSATEPVKRRQTRKEKRAKGVMPENFHPSTKIKALLGDLIQLSKANPYSSNYDPCSIEVQLVDNEGNRLEDGIVKTIVL